jgi:hypothetical protein
VRDFGQIFGFTRLLTGNLLRAISAHLDIVRSQVIIATEIMQQQHRRLEQKIQTLKQKLSAKVADV